MSVSVIIPAYKARKFLGECLESIGSQSRLPEEVLVIDDCSPEPVEDIIADFSGRPGYPPLRLLKHEVNRGQAAARNTGMKASRTEWLAFLDCDDLWAPNHLEHLISTAEATEADLAFCPAILFEDNPQAEDNYVLRPMTADETAMRPLSFLNRCFIITSSTLISRDCLTLVGGFDESPQLRGVEDLDCFLRLLANGARFEMNPEATLYYRKHPDSATGRLAYLARQDIEAKRRHIDKVEGTPGEKRTIMMQSYWRATIKLWLAKSPDRVLWLLRSWRHSLWSPLQGMRWSYRFLRAMRRKSASGL